MQLAGNFGYELDAGYWKYYAEQLSFAGCYIPYQKTCPIDVPGQYIDAFRLNVHDEAFGNPNQAKTKLSHSLHQAACAQKKES